MRQTEIDVDVPDVSALRRSVSVTALKRFWRCPLAFWIAYVARRGRPVSAGEWSLGSLVHGTLRRLFEMPTEQRTHDVLFELALAEWRVDHPTEYFEYLNLVRSKAANVFSLLNVQDIDVRGTEVPVELPLLGFTLRGRIDLLYRDAEGTNVIADFKSALRPPRSPLQDPVLTLRTYDLLLSRRYERPDTETALELLVLGDPPHAQRVGPIGSDERRRHLADVTERFDRLAQSATNRTWIGQVRPSCSGCAYFTKCPAIAAARRPRFVKRVSLSVEELIEFDK